MQIMFRPFQTLSERCPLALLIVVQITDGLVLPQLGWYAGVQQCCRPQGGQERAGASQRHNV